MRIPAHRLCYSMLAIVIVGTLTSGRALAWNQSFRDSPMVCNGVDQTCGHQWIIDQAIALLAERGWNRFTPAEVGYLKYGAEFADHPWLGRPEDPDGALPSVLDSIIPKGDSGNVYVDAKATWLGAIDAMVADGWTRTKANPFFDILYGADAFAVLVLKELQVAGDNQFHFPNGDLTSRPNVILFPEESLPEGTVVFDSGGVSAQAYGAVLYQLARTFWPSNSLAPSLARLPKRSDTGRGTLHNETLGDDLHVRLLTTYLGANPFLCADGQKPDLCAEGSPTWPVFVPEDFSLAELRNPTPQSSRRAALIYAGWAAHMIEDLEMPWHAMNWSGRQHQAFEDRADRLILAGSIAPDAFSSIAAELDLFGSRADYCLGIANLGVDTLPTGDGALMSKESESLVRTGFDNAQATAMNEVIEASTGAVRPWVLKLRDMKKTAPDEYVIDGLRRSVRDTVRLLSCIDGGENDGVDGIYAAEILAALSSI